MDLFDYLDNELATFDEKPLSAVDSAALSQVCMADGADIMPAFRPAGDGIFDGLADKWHALRTPGISFADLFRAEHLDGLFRGLVPERTKHELASLVASPRFRDLEIRDYSSVEDDEAQVQFAAMTFVWHGDSDFAYVCFRGTDSTFVGWRENFNMYLDPPVPAQTLAVEYLESVARHLPERLYVGGHSKGANLATYAAMRVSDEVRARIERVFDHDGPGFKHGFVTEADYELLAGRIDRTVPTESVVGMLMESHAPTKVVESCAHGIDAHSVFTWELAGDDFAYADGLAESAIFTRDVMNAWLDEIPDDEAPGVVDALFSALESSGATGVGQLFAGGAESIAMLREIARNADKGSRDILLPQIAKLAAIAARRSVAGVAEGMASAADAVAEALQARQ